MNFSDFENSFSMKEIIQRTKSINTKAIKWSGQLPAMGQIII